MEPSELSDLPQGRILGIDYGQRRTGIAICDPSQILSSSLKTLRVQSRRQLVNDVIETVQQYDVVAVVVGMPYNMDYSLGRRSGEVLQFTDSLRKNCPVPVLTWDERLSTVSAKKSMIERGASPSRNRNTVDQVAAAFILQSFLDRLKVIRCQSSRRRDDELKT